MLCTGCGYNLKAHASGHRCPECGLEVDETLWVEFERAEMRAPERRGTLVISGVWLFCAGAIVLLVLFALWRERGMSWQLLVPGIAAPALLAGVMSAVMWKRYAALWATVFVWPALLWGFAGAIAAPFIGPGPLMWPGIALVALAAAVLGARVGERIKRKPRVV